MIIEKHPKHVFIDIIICVLFKMANSRGVSDKRFEFRKLVIEIIFCLILD